VIVHARNAKTPGPGLTRPREERASKRKNGSRSNGLHFPIAPGRRGPGAGAARAVAAVVLAGTLAGCATLEKLEGYLPWSRGDAFDEVSFEDVPPADELYADGERILQGRRILGVYTYVNYSKAIESFQTIIDNYPYSDYAVEAELKIADAYYDDGKYTEALSYYRDFADLHPQNDRVPYTVLRSALCWYEQIRSVNRDQTPAREALVFLERLVTQYPYAPETREGERLMRELRTRLAENELQIGDFYLARQEYQSAAFRYRNLLDSYPGLGLDAEALYKLGVCYAEMKRSDEALRIFHVVVENFGDSEIAKRAADRIAESD
jgi:outer membrane protein assembly factor BamD